MTREWILLPALIAVIGPLSACNSTGDPYPQGPWGPTRYKREYPRYTAPWGGPETIAVEVRTITPPAVSAPPFHVEAGSSSNGRHVAHIEAPLPVDHPPRQTLAVPDETQAPAHAANLSQPSPPFMEKTASPPHASPPGVFSAPKRASSYAGSWKALDARGASCRVHLSSTPSLDLYKASTSGCSDEGLRGVNGWNLRENIVVLFSRGDVIARLSGEEASLSGTFSSSGGSLRMTR